MEAKSTERSSVCRKDERGWPVLVTLWSCARRPLADEQKEGSKKQYAHMVVGLGRRELECVRAYICGNEPKVTLSKSTMACV